MTILIVGGTGKTGSRVVRRLRHAGHPVRALSRSTSPTFDWHDEATWAQAIAGADRAYLAYAPDIALPGALPVVRRFTEFCLSSGLRRLVLLTGRGEAEALAAENALMSSGAEWTIVRSSWFAQNFSEGFFADEIRAGRVHFPRFDVPEPFIDIEDIADIVTAALIEPGHSRKLYDVTGPDLITFRDALAVIARALGRPIQTLPLSIPDYVAALNAAQVPAPYVQLLEILTTEVLDGRNTHMSTGVMGALGRPPRSFEAYVAAVMASGVWASEAAAP
ncbi:SDR family oxidoreductase [Devosia sediminis]|uniref:NAD(P)H-binding protein n=1 Tax=Devosia sediminis TaxID=2798801 RepID=A0A934IX37_9HYPH|nr:NAD(P)H-binding protein [Devosia sediminis]MBJ3783897.1 NAD(P)H-binding protein [Devosia sediminis]